MFTLVVTAKVKQLVSDIGEEFREELLGHCGVLGVCVGVCEWLVVGHQWVAPRQPTQECLQVGWPLHWGRHQWVLLPAQVVHYCRCVCVCCG